MKQRIAAFLKQVVNKRDRNGRNLTGASAGYSRNGKKDILSLDGTQLREVREALLSAFPTHQDLEMMVFDQLNEHLSSLARDGKLLFLLDALDEAAIGRQKDERYATYKRVFEAIEQLSRSYPQLPIVVTARIAGYRQLAPLPFPEYEVLPFRAAEIRLFIEKWFGQPDPQAGPPDPQQVALGQELNDKLSNTIRIQTLVTNPLLLSLTAILYQNHRELPTRRADLYKHCSKLLLENWDRTRLISRPSILDTDQKEQLLGIIAWHFHHKQMRYFPQDELLALISDFLAQEGLSVKQKQQVLDEISAGNGLLKVQADEWYGFLHLTLQEYFAAYHAVQRQLLNELSSFSFDPWWDEVIQLYAGSIQNIEPLLQTQFAADDIFFATNIILAGRCLAAYSDPRHSPPPSQGDVISRLFDLLQHTAYAFTREQVAATLAELSQMNDEVRGQLLQLLSDPHTKVEIAKSIVDALAIYASRALATDLLPLLFNTHLQDIHDSIAEALIQLGNHATIPQLLATLADKQQDVQTKINAVNILGRLSHTSLAPQLLTLLTDPNLDLSIRITAAYTLGNPDTAPILPDLLALLADPHTPPAIGEAIAVVIGLRGDPGSSSTLLSLLHQQQLSTEVLVSIADALSEVASTDDIATLTTLLTNTQLDPTVREHIALTIGKAGNKNTLADLKQLYLDPALPLALHFSIATALWLLGERSLDADLLRLPFHPQLRSYLRNELTEAVFPSASNALTGYLHQLADRHIDLDIRLWIAYGLLGKIQDRKVLPLLCTMAQDRSLYYEIRACIIKIIAQLGDDKPTAQALLPLLAEHQMHDEAQRALWFVSRRALVRVVPDAETGEPSIKC